MNEFHNPFIKKLVIIASVTLILMASTRYFLYNYHSFIINSPSFASDTSYNTEKTSEKQALEASSH